MTHPLHGFIIVDKPVGITSFDVIRIVRKNLGIRKVGHAGTLDPFASGVLLLATGNATKALSSLIVAEKTYLAKIVFGVDSDTLDIDGNLKLNEDIPVLNGNEIHTALTSFSGEIEQIPPDFSALKIAGKRACDRVRKGEEVTLSARKVLLHESELLELSVMHTGILSGSPSFVPLGGTMDGRPSYATSFTEVSEVRKAMDGRPCAEIRLRVGSGFYVRSFARDLGAKLGTTAIVISLRRESVGRFREESAIAPDKVTPEHIFSVSPHDFSFPSIILDKSQWEDFSHGRKTKIDEKVSGKTSVFCDGVWVGFGMASERFLFPETVIPGDRE